MNENKGRKVPITFSMMKEVGDKLSVAYDGIGDLVDSKPDDEANAWSIIAIGCLLGKARHMMVLFPEPENAAAIMQLAAWFADAYDKATDTCENEPHGDN